MGFPVDRVGHGFWVGCGLGLQGLCAFGETFYLGVLGS